MLHGICLVPGITIGTAQVIQPKSFQIKQTVVDDANEEIERFHQAISDTVTSIKEVLQQSNHLLPTAEQQLLGAHIQIASDIEIIQQVEERIRTESINAEWIYDEIIKNYLKVLASSNNPYLSERIIDVEDVAQRVIGHLLQEQQVPTIHPTDIIIAKDLSPSWLITQDLSALKGVILEQGGVTSHTAILLRARQIPAIIQVAGILSNVKSGDTVILDGNKGLVLLHPDQETMISYQEQQQQQITNQTRLLDYVNKDTITIDGHKVELSANIIHPNDVASATLVGADGIGLFRTEFLYMNRTSPPTEQEQIAIYKQVLHHYPSKNVLIRTLDVGGDKQVPYLTTSTSSLDLEHRGLRFTLEHKNLFKTQLRALLQAGVVGNLHVMFPMVTSVEDLLQAKQLMQECIRELQKEGLLYQKQIPTGMMIEVPEVVSNIDDYAKHVDFFSIGTNDLIQFTFHQDRMGNGTSQYYNPKLLQMIKTVIDVSHKEGIWTGMCGEMASDPIAAPILLGFGLDEFSMSASSILQTRHLFSIMKYSDMRDMANACLQMKTNDDVKEFVSTILDKEMTK